jgi:hypothetical protein
MNFKYNIGDTVSLDDDDEVYSGYSTWANMCNLTRWAGNVAPVEDSIGVIIQRAPHGRDTPGLHGPMYGVRDVHTGVDYIVGEKGIRLICDAPDNLTETLNDMIVEVCSGPIKEGR